MIQFVLALRGHPFLPLACVPDVLIAGRAICFSSFSLPHAGQAGTWLPRTSVSKLCWQAVQTKSNIGILAVSLCS
jgi:hypothetical protein